MEDEERRKLNPNIQVKAGITPAEEVKAAAADAKQVTNKFVKDKPDAASSGSNNQKNLKQQKFEQAAKIAKENLEKRHATAVAMTAQLNARTN